MFHSFVLLDKKMEYLQKLSEKEVIELFIVLYGNHFHSSQQDKQITEILTEGLINLKCKSILLEIKYFFLFLLEKAPAEKK
jgi:hypothetical protein